MDEQIMPRVVEWADQTTIIPLALFIIVICGIAMIVVPRKYAIFFVIFVACFIAMAQRIAIFSLDFYTLRIMVLFGLSRVLLRKEYKNFNVMPLDRMIIAFVASSIIIATLRTGSTVTLISELGSGFDAIGMYFLFRCLIYNWEDIEQIILSFILISIPLAVFFLIEHNTGRNMFSIFGGVPEYTAIREGKLRCQGAFPHPIVAGSFWASIIPLIAARFWNNSASRIMTIIGLFCAGWIVIASASSTPIFAVLFGVIGGLMFRVRNHLKLIRLGLIFILVSLHIVMQAPVWHLLARIDAVGGSTGYHRYKLIDSFISHFNEWWLLGTNYTGHWFDNAQDLTNQFVLEGVDGGLITLILFIIIIIIAFRSIGFTWHRVYDDKANLAMAWALGVSLFVHCSIFFGISYWGPITMLWYLTLAMITSVYAEIIREKHLKENNVKPFTNTNLISKNNIL